MPPLKICETEASFTGVSFMSSSSSTKSCRKTLKAIKSHKRTLWFKVVRTNKKTNRKYLKDVSGKTVDRYQPA